GLGFVIGPTIGALASLWGPLLPFLVAAAIAGVNALVAVRRLPETRPAHLRAPEPARAPSDRARTARRLAALAFVSLVAFSAFEATFALFGHARLRFTQSSTGAVFAGVGVVLVVVQTVLVRPAVARFGETGTLRLGLVLDTAGLVLLALTRSWWLLAPALVGLTVGQGLVMPSLTSRVAGGTDPRRRGGALGVQQSDGGLARGVGPVAGGAGFPP